MPNKHPKRMAGPLVAVLSVVAAGTLLAGCSSGSDSTDVAANDQSTSSSSKSQSGAADSALAYSKCMRENGVTNYPDPEVDSQGAVQLGVPEGIDQNSSTYKAAESACQSKLFQSDGDSAATRSFDATKVAPWAKCIRENGMPDFPDPTVQGETIIVSAEDAGITSRDDPTFTKATQACYSIRPGGNLMIVQALK